MAPSGSFPILFITATRIGDAVLSSGLVKRLSDEIPNARFTVVAGPEAAPLFAELPHLDELIVFRKASNGGHWVDLWSRVRKRRWGLVVDMRGSAINRFLRTKRRAIYHRPHGEPGHKVLEAARTLRIEDDPASPFLYVGEETEARAAKLTGGDGAILALAPAANWVGKTWPIERFTRTAMRLLGPGGAMEGGRLMVLGGPGDREMAAHLRDVTARGKLINLAGEADLLTAYACLKRARLFIGNDSGAMHLAAAAGAPTLGLFGPSDERQYAPWGPHARTVRGARSLDDIRRIDPGLDQALCHMMDLSVDRVVAAAEALLAATQSPARSGEGRDPGRA